MTRTLLISPSAALEEIYETVLVVETAIIEALKPGAKLSDVYEKGISTLKEKNARLVDKLYKKEFGFSTGAEFRESTLTISPKCEEKVSSFLKLNKRSLEKNITFNKKKFFSMIMIFSIVVKNSIISGESKHGVPCLRGH